MDKVPHGFEPVVFSDELPRCPDCGEPWGPEHNEHYAGCSCLGPTQDEVEYIEVGGRWYGKWTPLSDHQAPGKSP